MSEAISSDTTLSGPRQEPKSGAPAKEIVIMLHGLGADGQDLISLAPLFANAMPDAAFVAPDAPFPCDMAPCGRQWFSLQEREKDLVLEGMRTVSPVLEQFIAGELKRYNLSADRLVLMGFSQGGMMTLHLGPRLKDRVAGLISYSGMLIGPEEMTREKVNTPPVLVIHGAEDNVVPVQALMAAVEALENEGFTVSQQVIDGLGHGIDENGANTGIGFCMEVLGYAEKV